MGGPGNFLTALAEQIWTKFQNYGIAHDIYPYLFLVKRMKSFIAASKVRR